VFQPKPQIIFPHFNPAGFARKTAAKPLRLLPLRAVSVFAQAADAAEAKPMLCFHPPEQIAK
jgi:hypothetical protein